MRADLPGSPAADPASAGTLQPGASSPAPPATQPAPGAAPPAGPTARQRVLVADDNRDAAGSLAMLLQAHGHTVQQAFDGDQALALFERSAAQACLLDIGMPRRDGYSVARAIRRIAGPLPLLVAVTGWGQAHDRQRALDAGFDHHLTKPIDIDRLLRLLAGGTGRR